jgi:hypothetical protein
MKWMSLSVSLCVGLLLLAASAAASAREGADDLLHQPIQPPLFNDPSSDPSGDPPQSERPITPGRVVLTAPEIDALILPRSGAPFRFPSIDRFVGTESAPLEFRQVSLFADGSRIVEVAGGMAREQQRPARHYYLAGNRSAGIGLAVDPVSGAVSGVASKGGERLTITGDFVSGLQFEEIAEAEDGAFTCGNGEHDLSFGAPVVESSPAALSVSASAAGEAITYQAVVAVDTDTEWLAGFGNNTTLAMAWITNVFLAMNVLYERDVETRLLIGDVFLRTGNDPYNPSSDTSVKLNEFGKYWMENMDHVERQFATMFSGRSISPGWFSGRAWIDAYCDNGRLWGSSVPGSYSYNAIGSGFPATAAAHSVGHELGHNMGSPHTHCYSQPVDQCFSGGETYKGNPCYNGPTACPADGSGTVMSYCHGLAGCDSDTEFHPTVQALLENRLASELVAGCISPYTEVNPAPEFQSAPSAGALVQFGGQVVGTTSSAQAVHVQNIGDANLTLSCTVSGPGQAAFDIGSCAPTVLPSATADVSVTCAPGAAGLHQAVLTLLTNDPDEAAVDFNLSCNGLVPPEDVISQSSFEN